ncbi:hypothetical protein HDC37_000821 [Microbacterium sp. AK009]|uniref:hypothetical protein n=1 Tax=Microbacterium sp. AK009 TaxID=2723068 RepID=UPI0015CD5C65|nr:hypothetical protein [Microbacterium sp. AK009]NYF16007.1 hypothetical protein [Microbacterium sp. AK009]
MSDLAYMIRADWAQHATAMVQSSALIRDWVGKAPYLFAVPDIRRFNESTRNLDREAVDFIAPPGTERNVFGIADFGQLRSDADGIDRCVVMIHPRKRDDVETIRQLADDGKLRRVFVLVWWHQDEVRTWLDAHGALNLHDRRSMAAPDPLMLEAARMMIDEQYNGLSSGHGKDCVVHLVRAFAAEGYPVDPDAWLRAYLAAGGDFRHFDSVKKLVTEMRDGVKHRVQPRYVDNIFELIKGRASAPIS